MTRYHRPHCRRAAAAVVVIGALAVAGCSSDSSKPSSPDTKRGASSTSTRAGASATTASCPTRAQVTAVLGSEGQATGDPVCAGGYAAGSATNGQADIAYILVLDGSTWAEASDAQSSLICTTNPAKVPQPIVDAGCND
jgi:hypothetical protein